MNPTWRTRSLHPYPQEQGGLVKPPDTGFPFCCLLWLAGLGGGILTRLHMGLHTEVTGLYNSDADTIESSVWVSEETPSIKVCCQGNSFCTDSRTYFASVVARTCPATHYSPTEPQNTTQQQWAIEKTPSNWLAPTNLSARVLVIVTVCKL
jgi:hypothetical protein